MPPSPYWMHYVTSRSLTPGIAPALIDLADGFPDDPVIQYTAGVCLMEMGAPERALPRLETAVRRMPADAAVRVARTRARRAVDPFRETLVRDGGLCRDLGIIALREGRAERAESLFRTVLRASPDDASVHGNLGLALLMQKKHAAAVTHYQRAAELAPGSARYAGALGKALAACGRFDEAIAAAQRALDLARAAGDDAPARRIERELESYRRRSGPDARP